MQEPLIVLVVEDDSIIQHLAEETLTEGGFQVISASSAERAVAILDERSTSYRAVVTDVNLGSEKTGWDVARHARELWPDIAVVYMTGDSAAEWTAQGVPKSVLLTKPFAPAQLLTAVSQLLERGANRDLRVSPAAARVDEGTF